jgi:hypothetical protein
MNPTGNQQKAKRFLRVCTKSLTVKKSATYFFRRRSRSRFPSPFSRRCSLFVVGVPFVTVTV